MLSDISRAVNDTDNTTPPAGAGDEAILARLLRDLDLHPGAPLAVAVTPPDRDGRLTIECPYCGGRHRHGGGGVAGYGHRACHCGSDTNTSSAERHVGYIVTPRRLASRLPGGRWV
jgi:hypothetical protein